MAEDSKKSNNKNTTEETQQPKRCFVMMPFSDPEGYSPGHFRKVYEQIIKPAVENAGYEAYRVDENGVSDLITTKIFKAILDCDMAICDLSSRNPNVLYELGIRHAFDKPVVLINDDKTERIFDIQGISTVTYRPSRIFDEVLEDQKKITEVIKANENNSSGYSIISMVNLQKATYDANIKDTDSTEINNALLMRIINALDKVEKNQNDFDKQNFKNSYYDYDARPLAQTAERTLQDKIFKIDSKIKSLDDIIDNYILLNNPLEELKNTEIEIIKLISDINKLTDNRLLTSKQLDFLYSKIGDLERMLLKTLDLINHFTHS